MNKQIAQIETELINRELSKRQLSSFTSYTKKDYEMIAHRWWVKIHQQIIDKLEAVERWEIKRLMIFIRPRIWKSELASIRFPLWCLWKNPKRKIVISSYGADLAKDFWRKTRAILKDQVYKNVFPEPVLSQDKAEGWNWELKQWGWVYTVWVWWALTGKWFDIGIIDDPVKDREQAESETYQKKVIDWYTSTFYTRRQNQDSAIVLMMTRWNKNDLAWYLLAEEKNWWDKWEVLSIPAIDEQWNAIIWEWKWDKWYIEDEKKNVSPKDWSALYQQDPIASSNNIFKVTDLRYFKTSDFELSNWILKKEDLDVILAVDPAFSSSKTSDDAVCFTIWKHKISNQYYLLEWYADTSAPSHTFIAILSQYDKMVAEWYKIKYISIEGVNLNKEQTKFIEDFKAFLLENNRNIIINIYIPKGKKEDRIKFWLEPLVSMNWLHINTNMQDNTLQKRIENQFQDFPFSKKDDIIDCINQGRDMLDNKNTKQVVQKPKPFTNKMTGQRVNSRNPRTGIL